MTPSDRDESPLVRRLSAIARLTDEETEALRLLPLTVRELPARTDIVRDGETPSQCCLVLTGFLFRYKLSSEGARQILAVHVPGDIPDLQSLHLHRLDHTLSTLTAASVGFIAHETMHRLHARSPRLAGLFWRESLIDAAIAREWIMGLGQRDALARTAHFLCEIYARLDAVSLAKGPSVTLPFTQSELADALGMSAVHMNRTVQDLRGRQLIVLKERSLVVQDWDRLRQLGDFDPAYLHLRSPERAETA